jgi:glycogen(starch) synthase
MLSWEYPPNMVGGLGRHVDELSRALVAAGHEVRVVTHGTLDPSGLSDRGLTDGVRNGVTVHRAEQDPVNISFATETLLSWSQANEHSLTRTALRALGEWRPDVVHAHDWLVAQTAMTLSRTAALPLVATIHATEAGRNMGWLATELNRGIHSIERWLVHEADRVIVCSEFMREELKQTFDVGGTRLDVVGNGIDPAPWGRDDKEAAAVRERLGLETDTPLLVYAGRLVHAKGVHTLLEAMPALREMYPGLRLVIAGTGPYEADLREFAAPCADAVEWVGFLSDAEVATYLWAADVAIVPSLYEPFGLIALEAAAAGTPLAVADTGGLRDIVDDGRTGLRFIPDSAEQLAKAVHRLLEDPVQARDMAAIALAEIDAHTWDTVASQTAAVYSAAVFDATNEPSVGS